MSTLTTVVTAPLGEFITITSELGYQEFVTNPDLQVGGTIPNPQDRQAFLESYVKDLIVKDFTRVKIRAIDNAIRDERTSEKEALKTAIADAVNVVFVV